MLKALRIPLFIIVLLSAVACSPTLRIKPGEIPAVTPPPKEMKVEAESYVYAYIAESNYAEVKSGNDLKRVKNIVERLSKASGYKSNTFPVHIIDAGEEVNAAAFNGSSIVVYQELLKRIKSDDELAAVLGHEVGHIVANHFKDKEEEKSRQEAVSTGSSILGSIVSITASAVGYGGVSDLAGSATETATGMVGYGVFVGAFSRTQEYEADHLGVLIMARAGYNPKNAVSVWARSEEIFGSSGSQVGSFFSTHPASSARIEAINQAMPYAMAEYEKALKRK